MRWRIAGTLAVVLAAVFVLPGVAASQDGLLRELHPEADEAISKIRSPFCPGLMLEVCPTTAAQALRDSIQMRAESGLTADSLVEIVVSAYGEEYRAFPRSSGAGLLAWIMPPLALLFGAGLVILALRRWKGQTVGDATALTDEERAQLDAAMALMEESEQ